MAPPHDTPPTAAPTCVPGQQRSDVDTAHARLAADTFIGAALDDAKRAVNDAEQAAVAGDDITTEMWLAVAKSARRDAWHAARTIGRFPR